MEGLSGSYISSLHMTRNIVLDTKMAEKDLINFLKKIEQLNKISELIENDPLKKKELSECRNHEEVINLTSKWGFEIGKRWGE